MTLIDKIPIDYSAEWTNLVPTSIKLNLIHNIIFIIGLIMLVYGIISVLLTEKLFINEAVLALSFGILFGPSLVNFFNPDDYFGNNLQMVLLEFSRLIVSLCCTNIGIQLPNRYMWKRKRDMLMMLGPVMICMFVVMSVGVKLILGLSLVLQVNVEK